LGSGMGPHVETGHVFTLAAYDDGGGAALYAGGWFTTAGGAAANRIAKWDGSSWTALGSGMHGGVLALAGYDDGSGPALYAGGEFTSAIDSGDSFLAKWSHLDTAAVLNCPHAIGKLDEPANGPGEIVTFTITAEDDCDPAPVIECVPP